MLIIFFFLNFNIIFLIISLYLIISFPILNICTNLIKVNVSFLIFKIIYYNFYDDKFNYNYDYLVNRKIFVIDNFHYKDYLFINYKYEYFLGIKYKLYFILFDNFTLHVKDYEYIKKLTVDKNFYYNLLLTLTYKYSKYFKNIDIYILNNIKEFLY
jgi:hypothetical protein